MFQVVGSFLTFTFHKAEYRRGTGVRGLMRGMVSQGRVSTGYWRQRADERHGFTRQSIDGVLASEG